MKIFNTMKLIDFLNLQYKPEKLFKYYDDYACYLYFDVFNENDEEYYSQVEKDKKKYSDMQTGVERMRSDKKWKQKQIK